MTEGRFRAPNIKNPAHQKASAFFLWLSKEGRARFRRHYGEDYSEKIKVHHDTIDEWWQAVKASDERLKWQSMADAENKDEAKKKEKKNKRIAIYRQNLVERPEAMYEAKKDLDHAIRVRDPPQAKFAHGAPHKEHMYVTQSGFRATNIKNPANQKMSAYWMWLKTDGRKKFFHQYGEQYDQNIKDHKEQIGAWWNEVKTSDEMLKWESMAKAFNKDKEKVKNMREEKKALYRQHLAEHAEEMHELKKIHNQKIKELNPAQPKFQFGAPHKEHYGKSQFREQYGEDFKDGDKEHVEYITGMWNEVKDAEGGWEAAVKREGGVRRRAAVVVAAPVNPSPQSRGFRRLDFSRQTENEVDIRCNKTFMYLTSKLKMTMSAETGRAGGRSEDDVLRDLRSFVLIVSEYTSNAKGDRVCPAEVTLLTYSLSRGMQKVLSKVVLFKQSVVTANRDDLSEKEYGTLLTQYEKTGIPAERLTGDKKDPVGFEVIDIEKLRKHLLGLLVAPTDSSAKHAPIMFLKSNYNEAAGMLFTLFPESWEHLELRFCFLDDMFKVYSRVQNGEKATHPIRDYRDLPDPQPCPFHIGRQKKLREIKECTQQKAVRQLVFLFKELADARVLDMHIRYDPAKHQRCSEDDWDQDGPKIEWGALAREVEERYEEEEEEIRGQPDDVPSDADSDESAGNDDYVPRTPAVQSGAFGNQQSRSNDYYEEERRRRSQGSSGGGYGGRTEYGRNDGNGRRNDYGSGEAAKENWRGEGGRGGGGQRYHQGGNGYGNSSNYGGDRRNKSDDGERMADNRDYGNGSGSKYGGPPPGYDERDARPAQRRRAASPTYSEKGKGDKWEEEERWRDSQRSREDVRPRGEGRGGGSLASSNVGRFSRPNRPAEHPHQPSRNVQQQPQQRGVGVFGTRTVVEDVQSRRGEGSYSGEKPSSYQTTRNSFGSARDSYLGDNDRQNVRRDRNEFPREEETRREREPRERGYGGGRQTSRDDPHSPHRDGGKRREDRLYPEFGGTSSRNTFFDRGSAPARQSPEPRREEPKPETPQERADRLEDEKIASTIKFLSRGSFERYVSQIARQKKNEPILTPYFHPEAWSASVESGGYPLHPDDESYYESEVRKMQKASQGRRDYGRNY